MRRRRHEQRPDVRAAEALRGLFGHHDRHCAGGLGRNRRESWRLADDVGGDEMSKERKASVTVSLLFIVPLLLVAWILFAARDNRPHTVAEGEARSARMQSARDAEVAPITTHTEDSGYSDWQDQKRDEQRARNQAAYDADQALTERINDAANAAANRAVETAMNGEKPGY